MSPAVVGGARDSVRPSHRFAPDGAGWAAFWRAAAIEVAALGASAGGDPLAIVVPRGTLVAPLQQALRELLGTPGRPWAPPPIRPLAQWTDELAPAVPVDGLARTLGLLASLDEAMPDSLPGRSPADRLAFAGGLLDVLDGLAQAGAAGRLDDPEAVAGIVAAFGSPLAEERLRADLNLLGRIADATAGDGHHPVAQQIARMHALADAWARRGTRVVWLAWQQAEGLEAVLLSRLAERLPAGRLLRLEPDWAAVGDAAPLMRAAWPECFGWPEAPLRDRRASWRDAAQGPKPVVLHAADREREAQLAAQWVHARLADALAAGRSPPKVAIVALDRWLARRVRALLERAEVLIDDREGWLLSTTVAASAAMGWLDAVGGDGYYDDLLGWMDSRFVRPAGHRELRAWVERRATHERYLRGWDGLRGVEGEAVPSGVGTLIEAAAQQRRAQPLRMHLERLDDALRWAGAHRRLATDAAGRQVLGLLDALRRTAASADHARSLPFAEFRALLGMAFERHRFFGAIDSPVELLTPVDAAGRAFDAVIVLGAADGALPSPPPPLPLVNEPLRAILGLPTGASQAVRQQRDLVLLLTLAGEAALTCRTDPVDGTRPSPWVERLEAITGDIPLKSRSDEPGGLRRIAPTPSTQPSVPLSRMPVRLSVGGIERLVACPFRFLAQDGWRLRETHEAVDVPGVRERGELVHEILERFHRQALESALVFDPGTRDALRALLLATTEAVTARELASGGGALGEIAEWRATLDGYLDWSIDDAAGRWAWQDGECEAAATVVWEGPDGPRSLRIEGRLDRLDEGPSGQRIVDYKLGAPDRLRTIAATPDRAAQLAIYALMAAERGPVAATGYLSLRRDAVSWVPLKAPVDEVIAAWRGHLPRYLARIDGGEPLSASGSECGHCASRGLCRKGHWT
jgi:ATP-dependent helicase/nuclease subunit B